MFIRSMTLPTLALLVSITACNSGEPPAKAATEPDAGAQIKPGLASLTNTPLRYDGVYRYTSGNVHSIMRFFPEGNVVLISGTDTSAMQMGLRARLDRNTATDGVQGIHNVPVLQRNDSLLFVTRPMKGEIDYSGVALGPDSVRFLKHSHINGKSGTLTYVFEADPGS